MAPRFNVRLGKDVGFGVLKPAVESVFGIHVGHRGHGHISMKGIDMGMNIFMAVYLDTSVGH